MLNKWSNVPGLYSIEISSYELCIVDTNEKEIPCLNAFCFEQGITEAELIIEFLSNGFYDPGKRWGGPHNLGYPPEGEEERLLHTAYLVFEIGLPLGQTEKIQLPLPESVGDQVFDLYSSEVDAVELEAD